jgi:uncharacterized protein
MIAVVKSSMKNEVIDMRKHIIVVICILAMVGIVTISLLRDKIVGEHEYTVSVLGQGKVSYQPDVANITLGVEVARAKKASVALTDLNSKIKGITEAVKALGVTDADITTQFYSLYPQYDYNNGTQTQVGYTANQQILVRVRGLKSSPNLVGNIIEQASLAGANQVQGVEFAVSNIEELKQKARALAIADAKAKSASLAESAGVRLGDIIGWVDGQIVIPVPYYGGYGGGGGGAGSAVVAGPREIVVEMSVQYEIE